MMRLERVDLYHISMPLVTPFETSGWVEMDRECILVAVHARGTIGWGECVASSGPWYSYETVGTAWHVLTEFLIPMLFEADLISPEQVPAQYAPVRGHNMAKAGLEAACWDLFARREARSLSNYLGGTRDSVEVGVSVGIQGALSELVERVTSFVEQGYRRIKIKIKPGWDIQAVQAVRRHFPELRLQVDANSAYTLHDLDALRALDDYDLVLIEQPLGHDDLVDHAKIQAELSTPICLDESIHSAERARQALELTSCRIVNIKPGRVGGLSSSIQIHDMCEELDVPVWCGGMLETGVGRAHNVALATLPNFRLPGDISATDRYYYRDIATPMFQLNRDSTLTVPQGDGIGVDVDLDFLHDVTLRQATFDQG